MLRLGQGSGKRLDQPATRGAIPPFGPSAWPLNPSLHALPGAPSLGCGAVSQY